MEQIDIVKIREAVADMPIASDVLSMFKDRTRGRQDSSFRRIMRLLGEQGKKHRREDLAQFFAVMQEAGAGRLIFSKNKDPRFIWTFNLKSIARAALAKGSVRSKVELQAGPRVSLPEVGARVAAALPREDEDLPPVSRETHVDSGAMIVRRAGFEVTLPLDLTPEQAKAAQILLSGLHQ